MLRHFLAVASAGNFTRAAAQINVTQPTLSISIAKLESQLQSRLFNRTKRHVHLTVAGTNLLTHARKIESEFNRAERSISGASAAKVIRIGFVKSLPNKVLTGILESLSADLTVPSIEILEGNEREIIALLERNRVDLAVSIIRPNADKWHPHSIESEGYALALPARHRLSDRRSVAPEELANETMIVRRHCEALNDVSRHFVAHGVRPFFAYRTDNDERALAMVRASLGITVMPQSHKLDGVVHPELIGFTQRRIIGLLFSSSGIDGGINTHPMITDIESAIKRELA